jgi:uncharacterized protein (TIRG00374 family)
MKKLTKHIRYFFLVVGAVLLILLIQKIGIATILYNIQALGWRFAPILCISGMGYTFYTIAWMLFLNRLSDGIGFFELFRIKISGEAINTLTPANFIGGDPMRIYLLKKNFPLAEGAASVVVDRTLQSVAILVTVLLGIIVAFLKFDELSANITYGVPIVLVVACGFMGFLLVHQRRGMFGLILNICKRLGIKRQFSERTVRRITELDGHIVDFYNQNHRSFLIALGCHIVGRLLGVVEIYAIGRVVSDDFSIFAALMLAALAPMVMALFAFVPGAIGIMEGAFSGVLYLLHLDPSIGITIQIAKRLRSAFWISLGLLFMGAHDRHKVFEEKDMIEQVEEIGTV